MDYQYIKAYTDGKIGHLVLARPDKHNAFDDTMIAELRHALEALAGAALDAPLHALVLSAEGKHFCAGADLEWMKRQAQASQEDNLDDAMALAELLNQLDRFPAPVVAQVQGAAFGGALGLIACADVVIAQPNSRFCLSEVKLGLIPATISPYVHRAIGARQMRRYALTAELIVAAKAQELGLVHELAEDLDAATAPMLAALFSNGPKALKACKQLLDSIEDQPIDRALRADTAQRIADIRVSPEGQEGLGAFFAKRAPQWQE